MKWIHTIWIGLLLLTVKLYMSYIWYVCKKSTLEVKYLKNLMKIRIMDVFQIELNEISLKREHVVTCFRMYLWVVFYT